MPRYSKVDMDTIFLLDKFMNIVRNQIEADKITKDPISAFRSPSINSTLFSGKPFTHIERFLPLMFPDIYEYSLERKTRSREAVTSEWMRNDKRDVEMGIMTERANQRILRKYNHEGSVTSVQMEGPREINLQFGISEQLYKHLFRGHPLLGKSLNVDSVSMLKYEGRYPINITNDGVWEVWSDLLRHLGTDARLSRYMLKS
jgi:hypothetical protein